MGNLEIARLCQTSLPRCFMCSCAGQRPHFGLLIRGNGKSICKCWMYFFSIAYAVRCISVRQANVPAPAPHWSPVSSCSVCMFVVPSFLIQRDSMPLNQSIRIQIRLHLQPLTCTRARAQHALLHRFFCFSFNCVFSIMQTDANLQKMVSNCCKK